MTLRRKSVDRRPWNKGEEVRWWRFFMGLEATHPGGWWIS